MVVIENVISGKLFSCSGVKGWDCHCIQKPDAGAVTIHYNFTRIVQLYKFFKPGRLFCNIVCPVYYFGIDYVFLIAILIWEYLCYHYCGVSGITGNVPTGFFTYRATDTCKAFAAACFHADKTISSFPKGSSPFRRARGYIIVVEPSQLCLAANCHKKAFSQLEEY